jgi:hypothetical protein
VERAPGRGNTAAGVRSGSGDGPGGDGRSRGGRKLVGGVPRADPPCPVPRLWHQGGEGADGPLDSHGGEARRCGRYAGPQAGAGCVVRVVSGRVRSVTAGRGDARRRVTPVIGVILAMRVRLATPVGVAAPVAGVPGGGMASFRHRVMEALVESEQAPPRPGQEGQGQEEGSHSPPRRLPHRPLPQGGRRAVRRPDPDESYTVGMRGSTRPEVRAPRVGSPRFRRRERSPQKAVETPLVTRTRSATGSHPTSPIHRMLRRSR